MSEHEEERFEIGLGGARAVISDVGACLLEFQVDGQWYAHSREPAHPGRAVPSAGKVMTPWPNRTAGGRWTFEDEAQQLEITEPARNNAIHGLVGELPWTLEEHGRSHVSLAATIDARPGWPVPLRTTVRYEVGGWGLRVTHGMHNLGERATPFGLGTHPYLLPGPAPLDDCELRLQASQVLPYDPETKLPGEPHHVQRTGYDIRRGQPLHILRELDLDNTFGRCRAGRDGAIRHSLSRAGEGVELWTDNAFRWVHAFLWLPGDPPGMAVAIEPMTCPPNALNSGTDLITLRPGTSWHANWGIRPLHAPESG